MAARTVPATACLFAAVLLGCTGLVDGESDPGPGGDPAPEPAGGGEPGPSPGGAPGPAATPPAGPCTEGAPATSPLRRLTREEYSLTVRELLNDRRNAGNQFPDDDHGEDLIQGASSLIVSPAWAEQALRAAEELAQAAVANLTPLLPCRPQPDEAACARQFIQTFGKRAYRRPLASDEVARLHALWETGRAGTSFEHGIGLVIRAMLVSPHFLYRLELGGARAGEQAVRLTQYEIASRLSYFLWRSMPDATLLAAAEAGKLGTREEIGAQARRMLGDARARAVLLDYHQRWLGFDELDEVVKDRRKYPTFPRLVQPMKNEARYFLEHVLFKKDGRLESLLLEPVAFVNTALAPVYEAPPPAGESFVKVDLDPARRAGVLTTAAFLATHSHADETAAIFRGKWVRSRLLCTTPPDPPADLMIVAPTPKPGMTSRQRLAEHSSSPACRGCHELIDPIGLGFEHYDGIGRWRDTEQGKPVDASSTLGSTDVDGPFRGVPELARKLAGSEQVRACVVSNLLGYAQGLEAARDLCTVRKLRQAFSAASHDVRALAVAITQTDAFQLRRALPGEVLP